MPPELTPTRQTLIGVILRLGTQATASELAREMGISKPAITRHLDILRELGYVAPAGGRYTPITLTSRAKVELGIGIPIYGQIAAGQPTLAEQSPEDVVPDLDALFGKRPGDFLLTVRGDSMTGIGVMPGDLVLVRPTAEVLDGEVAVVLIKGENTATLKRVTHFVDKVLLDSENPDYSQMVYATEDVQIQGKMIGKIGLHVPRSTRRR